MTVFKTFLKVLNKCKFSVILNTVILLIFAGVNMQASDTQMNFEATKPDILIVNQDTNIGITQNLTKYLEGNCEIIAVKDNEDAINDALFYRDVNYVIYIPQNYRQDVLKGENPEIQIKSTGDYQASYAEMLLARYVKVQNIYVKELVKQTDNKTLADEKVENEIIEKINQTISKQTEIEMTSKLDTTGLEKATFYYNFANYTLLAGAILVICLILFSFHEEKIRKRTIVSSMKYQKHNRILLLSNGLFALVLWLFYVLISFFVVGNVMFSTQGLIYIVNSFVFTLCALTIAVLVGNIVNNKNAMSGIVNVIALGSSFLCGAFVPVEWLPDTVLKIAHCLPSYWYIQSNEIVKTMEELNLETLKPIMINMGVVLLFSIGFVIVTNLIARKKRKIA
ncbi:MAG: ABC transporter permease [Clostridia bacterium]|nr:ABC transporter permease [Clostridia bacterium]